MKTDATQAFVPDVPESGSQDLLRFPCSSSQQRCWFINALDPGSAALNVALRWDLTGPVRDEAIEQAFNMIVARHEALRTRFVDVDGEPMQEVVPELTLTLDVVDLRHLPPESRAQTARQLAERESHLPFDLYALPLTRITLLRMADDRVNILLTVHQIVFDGWSIRVMANEFGECLAAIEEGRAPELPELPLQYGDYARWQKEYLAVEAPRHERYWYDQLVHAPYFEVPGDFPKPDRPSHRGIILAEMLSPEMGGRMEETARRLGVTPFALGCAATVAMLRCVSGWRDITIGTQVAGRDDADLENLVGVFINNVVLRVDTRHVTRFSELLARTNDTVREGLVHQAMPFHRLVELLNPPRDPARTPLISVNFTMLKGALDARSYGPFHLDGVPSVSAGSLYDLNFFVVRWPDGWRMAMEYNPDIFSEETGRAFLALWHATMQRATLEPDFALESLVAPERKPVPPREVKPAAAGHPGAASAVPARVASPATEQALAAIWRDVLGVAEPKADADFFALGGHSLLAIRMLSRVREHFGHRIDPLTLFEAPTLGQLAAHIDGLTEGAQADEASADAARADAARADAAQAGLPAAAGRDAPPRIESWNVVRIQPEGQDVPIIAINNTLAYRNVALAIGTAHPFIGVQLFDPNSPRVIEERPLEAFATDYVALIRAARPHGPYVLFGLCVAGALAYEAARQLEEAGEVVSLVVLADTWRPGFIADLPAPRRARFQRAYRWHMLKRHMARLSARETGLADVLATYPSIRRTGVLRLAGRVGMIEDRAYNQEDWGNRWFLATLERARNAYRPRPIKAPIVLLRSEEMITADLGEDMGWSPLLPQVPKSYAIPGWHADMFQGEGARIIAAHLQPLLRQIPARKPRSPQLAAE
ncbi:condensation domain-containing protein [Ancylobacter sp. 6x-1]|uniref:Condensation domain-containing protein n=1 Tax=Ancylobacter crimeensis TaxID=2579147 RepID=A0ABT0DBC0_9HYPH|nr:condensation domain-containing protein [Ancylobacter crimeensis]MCK0197262.1 condensation domain-containing protein [Ancylobacter crimeensis]